MLRLSSNRSHVSTVNYPIPKNPDELAALLLKVRIESDRRACVSLAEFAKRSWPILEPSTKLAWGRALDIMCAQLERIARGKKFQPRKLMNVPPGMMKSLLCSVIFPAWVWTFDPSKSFTGASHEAGLANRDARKMRILIQSEWYQERWPLGLALDQNTKINFENEKRGFRQAVPFGSMTGRRSDFVIIDDPHSAEDANSDTKRAEATRIFRETLPTRINNDDSAIIVIMQRLHEGDISGLILANDFGYDTLILPMRFDPARADPQDWRTIDGELLFPERFGERSVVALEKILMAYGTAGQLQQRPTPRGGGMFKLVWFDGHYIDTVPPGTRFKRWWDLAATKDPGAAYTAGVLLGKTPQGRYIVAGVNRFQEEPFRRNALIKLQCTADKAQYPGIEFFVPKDPGAGGKVQTLDIITHLDGFNVRGFKEVGDKESRAEGFSAQCEGGNVDILGSVGTPWVDEWIDEITNFPGAKWKDQVDATVNVYGRFVAEIPPTSVFVAPMIIEAGADSFDTGEY